MTSTANNHLLLDHLLCEIQAGHASDAILMFAGMLDACTARLSDIAIWRQNLANHPARLFLQEVAAVKDQGAEQSCALTLLSQTDLPKDTMTRVSCLHHTLSKLGSVRGLQARLALSQQTIDNAWQQGKNIALFGCGTLGEIDHISGHDHSNVFVDQGNGKWNHGHPAFDLILANSIADDLSSDELAARLAELAKQLNSNGRLIISAFAPGHLGQGWQQICLSRELVCHDEAILEAAAQCANLSIKTFRDASNSLIWAELRCVSACDISTGENHGNGHIDTRD